MDGFGIILIDNSNTDPYKAYEGDIACFNYAQLLKLSLPAMIASSLLLFYDIIK